MTGVCRVWCACKTLLLGFPCLFLCQMTYLLYLLILDQRVRGFALQALCKAHSKQEHPIYTRFPSN